jgi:GGDEF domain-containing protein
MNERRPSCDRSIEARRLHELQNAVALHPFEPRPGVRVTPSNTAGLARYPVDGQTFEELLAVADERMYRDKAGRRSRHSGRVAATARDGLRAISRGSVAALV